MQLAQFVAQCLESTAYHEAGHTTAAVLQRMPLRERGIHVDMEGSGVSYYRHRSPGDPRRSREDQLEREQTIIALYSGIAAQRKFFPECPDEEAWSSDMATIRAVVEEMHPAELTAGSATLIDLQERAEQLVADNWSTVERLASTLLAKDNTALPEIEIQEGWSRGKKATEKFMPSAEIVEFFERLGIAVLVLPD